MVALPPAGLKESLSQVVKSLDDDDDDDG